MLQDSMDFEEEEDFWFGWDELQDMRQQPEQVKKRIRTVESKEAESIHKKQKRTETRDQLMRLRDLEMQFREQEGGKPVVLKKSLPAVLSYVIRRLQIVASESGGARRIVRAAAPEPDPEVSMSSLIVEGMMSSCTMGAMFVDVEKWIVRHSNSAMARFCSFEPVRGYQGHQLCTFVRPDDHKLLQIFAQQAQMFQPGDPLVLNVRLLRMCTDNEALICDWVPMALEVANVTFDKEHEGRMHVLFTCAMSDEAIRPLVWDEEESHNFDIAARYVSGEHMADPANRSKGDFFDCMDHFSSKHQEKQNGTPSNKTIESELKEGQKYSGLRKFCSGLFAFMGKALNNKEGMDWITSGSNAMKKAVEFLSYNLIIGRSPNGVPWIQKSCAVQAFGMKSNYRTFVSSSLSGTLAGQGSTKSRLGLLKFRHMEGGWKTSGCFSIVFHKEKAGGPKEEQPRIFMIVQNTWDFHPGTGAVKGHDVLVVKNSAGVMDQRYDVNYTRKCGPNPELLRTFHEFNNHDISVPVHSFADATSDRQIVALQSAFKLEEKAGGNGADADNDPARNLSKISVATLYSNFSFDSKCSARYTPRRAET